MMIVKMTREKIFWVLQILAIVKGNSKKNTLHIMSGISQTIGTEDYVDDTSRLIPVDWLYRRLWIRIM